MAETKKYVRIMKAAVDGVWYADKIGQVFKFSDVLGDYYLVEIRPAIASYVPKKYAELIVTEKRPARVGERVLITESAPIGKQAYEAGDVFEVAIADDPFTNDIRVLGMPDFIDYNEYEVIVNNEVKYEEADGMESVNKTAIDSASTVFEKVGEDYIGSKSRFGDILIGAPYSEAFVNAYANERKDVLVIPQTIEYTAFLRNEEMKKVATHGQAPIVSAQARRDEIVEQAKADVEKRITNNALDRVVYFVPNRIKRTVVALIKGEYSGKVYAKGIAKAAPNDCFNVHIGKAIALRRALCLAVPDEYLNAPQPTEIRVGDVVRGKYEESYYQYEGRLFGNSYEEQIKEIEDGKFRYISGYYDFIDSADLTIIDDSREEVGGE